MGTLATVLSTVGKTAKESTKSPQTRQAEAKGQGGDDGGGLIGKVASSVKKLISPKKDSGGSDLSATSYHKGGTVRKTGLANLKKGERVLTKRQAKRYRKLSRKG